MSVTENFSCLRDKQSTVHAFSNLPRANGLPCSAIPPDGILRGRKRDVKDMVRTVPLGLAPPHSPPAVRTWQGHSPRDWPLPALHLLPLNADSLHPSDMHVILHFARIAGLHLLWHFRAGSWQRLQNYCEAASALKAQSYDLTLFDTLDLFDLPNTKLRAWSGEL
jgi:hypothetical protein